MLCNIDSYWIEDARRMMTMLCFASRPLTVQELIDSVAVELEIPAGLNRKRRLQDSDGIREICGGLVDIFLVEDVSGEVGYFGAEDEDASEDGEASVEISHNDPPTSGLPPNRIVPTVRIAHFSVQEYLESRRIHGKKAASFGLSSITAHAEIAEVCLIYLLEPGLSRSKTNQAILKEYPLAYFAATYWYYHYTKTEKPTGLDTRILRLFQSQTSFATWERLHNVDDAFEPDFVDPIFPIAGCSRRRDDIPTPVYYASLLGLDKVLHGLLQSEQVESTKTSAPALTTTPKASKQTFSAAGRLGGALQAASYHGNDHIIQILLDSGFDINDRGGYDDKGSALQVTSFLGHKRVVQILLDRGADINVESLFFANALQVASGQGHKEVVEILLNRGADVNAQSGKRGSALQQASCSGHEEIVQILLDRGADVNEKSESYGSALIEASAWGNREVVEMLLNRGADINAQRTGYRGALQEASRQGHKEVVEILLARGADVNLQSQRYGTALCGASRDGRGEIVQMLIDSGARVSIGRSRALLDAIQRDDSDIVHMLLENMTAEDFDNECRMASSIDSLDDWGNWDEKISELLKTRDFSGMKAPGD